MHVIIIHLEQEFKKRFDIKAKVEVDGTEIINAISSA